MPKCRVLLSDIYQFEMGHVSDIPLTKRTRGVFPGLDLNSKKSALAESYPTPRTPAGASGVAGGGTNSSRPGMAKNFWWPNAGV